MPKRCAQHIDAAIRQQAHEPVVARSDGRQASPASLKSDLMMAREEITALRQERDRLREAVRQHLGQQLEQVSNRQLIERIAELTEANRRLEHEEGRSRAEAEQLTARVASLESDLVAARTSLRPVIRDENRS
jgi:chromosome segregation ATPase